MQLEMKINNLRQDLSFMKQAEIKPNYKALGDKHGINQRTVKKYHEGYEGKPSKRNKASKLDKYKEEKYTSS